jgi:transcriptional regulator with XRE-family HTH domain
MMEFILSYDMETQEPRQPERIDLDSRIAVRIRQLRTGLGLTIDGLAERSGVSRAMISKVERGEASPTAALLGRLANALGTTLSKFFSDTADGGPLVRAQDRPVWRDPATGYLRRAVTPESYPADIVDVTLPAGASVTYDNAVPLSLEQVVWVLDGTLRMTVNGIRYDLAAGDCLQMTLEQPITFANVTAKEARYAVVLSRPPR